MLVNFFGQFGAWNWIALGLVLLALEIFVPGVYLLWIGIAAVLTGALSLQLADAAFWTWQAQVVVFLVLSLSSAFIGKKIMKSSEGPTDEPLLNRRAEQLVGRTATLGEPIVNGVGRVRLGDTLWRVSGPDLPSGTRVRVTGALSGELKVEPE